MPTDPSDSSSESDLARAAAASRRLVEAGQGHAAPAATAPEKGFVAFHVERFRRTRTPPPPAAAPATPAKPPPGHTGMGSDWQRLLEWARESTHARLAFVVDASGLLVATAGAGAPERVEAVGARLVLAFEQADGMAEGSSPARSVAIQFDDGWLWGMRLTREAGGWIALGAVVPSTPDPAQQDRIRAAFAPAA